MRVRGLILAISVCAVTSGGSLLVAASAVAAAPESPETGKASSVTATTATLEGTLNPHASSAVDGGEYEFLYNYFSAECENAFAAPEPADIALGLPQEAVSVTLTSLQPSLKYTFCLEERSIAEPSEIAKGLPVTFETNAAPPAIANESAPEVKASEATLAATINPNNQETAFVFEYATKATGEVLEGPVTTIKGEGPIAGYEEPGYGVQVVTGDVLTQATTYYFRASATNAKGERSTGKVEQFTTTTPEAPETRAASMVTPSTATLHGVLNPKHSGEGGTYDFVYERSPGQCHQGNSTRVPEPPETALGNEKEAESLEITGLLPGATYTYCLIANTPSGEAIGPPITFTTLPIAASAGEESFSKVGSSSAELRAQVDPGGAPTTYFFEYGQTPAYGSTTPTENAGAGSEPVSVQAKLEGLMPDTTYYFRVVVSNPQGPNTGKGISFSTFPAELSDLPDGRDFEAVSPLENGDSTVLMGTPMRAAAAGNSLAYIGTAPPTGGTGEITIQAGIRPNGDNVYLAKRSPEGGWNASDIQPDGLNKAFYQGFSSDLSIGIISSEQALLPGAPNGEGQQGLYTRENDTGNYRLLGPGASYAGSTPDGLHVLFQNAEGLYDSVGGVVESVSMLPEGQPDSNATFGSPAGDLEHFISNGGSRIFWTDATTGSLYVRENDTQPDARTILIAENAQFQTASTDGTKVFFTSEKQLIAGSTAATGAPDLYEYNLETGTLVDLTIDTNPGEHANVVGILGTSTTGSYIYFAAAGDLTHSTTPQECRPPTIEEPPGNRCNVYVVHDDEAPKLVATVATGDGEGSISFTAEVITTLEGVALRYGDWAPRLGYRSAYVSNDGSRLVFESVEDLTGFHATGGREIYEYDINNGVSCVSCNPSGASTINGPFFDVAHSELPPSLSSAYALRDVSADGNRVFFESNEQLVSNDTNEEGRVPGQSTKGLTNVYEWERDGTGSCGLVTGCIYLLSTGESSDISFFVDASENGSDVFIGTRAQLVPQDHGEVYEVFDAHECTSVEPCPRETSTACTGASCQGLPSPPPIFATPSSATFTGVGNFPPPPPPPPPVTRVEKLAKALKACRKDRAKKKRAICEKSARKRYGVSKANKKSKKTGNKRGTKRGTKR
jgi:Tol biopolymer transport system component